MHTKTHRLRAARLGVVAAVAALSVALLGGAGSAQATATQTPSVDKVVALHETMDKLWTDHTTYTRLVIIDFFANSPELKPHLARLLRNQVDIGNAIKPFYGPAAGNQLTALLRTHIKEAVPVLQAAKTGNKPALKTALAAWYANAHQIAAFLSKANPANWPLRATTAMMNTHLGLTTQEAVFQLKGNWRASIATYDKVRGEILMMAHTLADGIVKQFPDRVA